jgi:O-antigen/teichoic acid export membrane protein
MASQLLDTLYNNITPVFIGKYFSPADLGVYNRAENYAKLPSLNVYGVISSVTFPVLSKMQDDDEALAHNYRRILKVTACVVFPMMTLLAGLARPLILVMITTKWEACIILLQIICFSMMWLPIHAINLNLLIVKGRSDLFLRLEIIKKIWGVIILACTLPFGLIIFCSGRILTNLVCLFINTYYTGKLINCGYFKQMHDLMPTFFMSLLAFAVSIGMTYIFDNLWLQLLFGGICGAGVYLGIAILFKMDEMQDVKYMLKRKQ